MTDRTIARLAGVLFVVASAAAIVGGTLLMPVEEPDALVAVTTAEARIVSGVLVELVLVWSVVGIAALLFPVLRRRDEGLALGYVGARIVEGVLLLAAAVSALLVLALARDPASAGAGGLEPLGELLVQTREWTYLLGSLVALGVSALLLYGVLYRARLVPTWLSLWGVAGGVLILVRGVLETYGLDLSAAAQGLLAAPIAVNEMVLAGWLIVKGFARPTPARAADTQRASVGV